MKAPFPGNETERLETLRSYRILDTPPEKTFDDLTRLAADLFKTPMAVIGLLDVDRYWFKSKVGLEVAEIPRRGAFCDYAVWQRDPLVVPDMLTDERFATHPMVVSDPSVRFYAAAPLIAPDGYPVGTLCVFDLVPREFGPKEKEILRVLADQVVALLELRRLAEIKAQREETGEQGEKSSGLCEHNTAEQSIRLKSDKETLEREIAERKRVEAELKNNLSFLNATLEAISNGILVTNQQGTVVLSNSKFMEMWDLLHPVATSSDQEKATASILKPLKDPETFSAKLKELNESDSENHGTLEFRNGRILAWYSRPQQIGGERMGRVWCFHDICTERKQAEERVNRLANFDLLTNLPNRILFRDRLELAISRAPRHKRAVGILLLYIDRFEVVNEMLGHVMGDLLLKAVSKRLAATVREGDTVARLGDDMFGLILDDLAQAADSFRISQKILDTLSKPFELNAQEIFASASIGIAISPHDGDDVDLLMKHADTAMRRAKEQGGNNYQLYSPAMNQHATKRLALESSLHHALEREEFLLYYQPKVDLATGQIVGMEALVRWKSPELGMVSPAEFIPLAEETGLIVPMGEWILRTACAQNKRWQQKGLPMIRVGVNLSVRQLQRQNLIGTIAHVLNETGLDPNYLELELTESIIMRSNESTMAELRELHLGGIEISIDDFGTGYSSLSYLKRLPIHTLKIDRSFVQDVTTDPDDAAIVAAIITMAHTLKLKVVAEAVETVEQLAFLRSLKCDRMQGYLFSKPLPAAEVTRLLAEGKHL